MVEAILDFLKEFNLQTIVSMGIMLWFFSRNIKSELKNSIDNLDRDIRAMNTRMSRLEGTVYGKDVYKYTGSE